MWEGLLALRIEYLDLIVDLAMPIRLNCKRVCSCEFAERINAKFCRVEFNYSSCELNPDLAERKRTSILY